MTFGNVVRRDEISAVSFDEVVLTEFVKDRWNVDHIIGARRGARGINGFRWIDFREVPERFRPLVKQWCQVLLAKFVTEHCGKTVQRVKCFLMWLVEHDLEISTLRDLTTSNIDTYLGHLRSTSDAQGKRRSEQLFWKYVHALRSFLEYLELTDHPCSPLQPVSRLVDYQRIGKPPSRRYDRKHRPKYIPESVLTQLDQHIEHLPPTQIPVVIVLRASGWRISDVLNLRLNTCLEHDTQGWSLCGDISKTGWLSHRIPLTEEVAIVIEAQQTWVRQNYTEDENPSGYLFPYVKNKGNTQRRGQNLHANSVNNALQRLAKRYLIVGENGEVFHFHTRF